GIQARTGQDQRRPGQDHQHIRRIHKGGAGFGNVMTNTLHRYGSAESFYDDYIIFAIPSMGKNDKGSLPKLKQFLEMALAFKPVNLADALNGGALRPRRDMTP